MAKRFFWSGEEVVVTRSLPDGYLLVKLRKQVCCQGESKVRTWWERMPLSEYRLLRLPLGVLPAVSSPQRELF